MSRLLEEVENRLQGLLQRVAMGGDVPPGLRYRLEGMLEAAALCGEATEAELEQLVERVHQDIFGVALAERLWDGWEALFPFPGLPIFADRAPVSPSTPD